MLYIITNKRILLPFHKSWIIHHCFITNHNLSHHPSQYFHYFLNNKKIIQIDKVDFYIQKI